MINPAEPAPLKPTGAPIAFSITPPVDSSSAIAAGGIGEAAAGLIEAGIKFIESIASDSTAGNSPEAPGRRFQQILSSLFRRDPATNRSILSIPLPESLNQERVEAAISGLVNALGRKASAAAK